MPNPLPSKPFSLVHLRLVDANTGETILFQNLPADVDMVRDEPKDTYRSVTDAQSYLDRMKQIEGPSIKLSIRAETHPILTRVIVGV